MVKLKINMEHWTKIYDISKIYNRKLIQLTYLLVKIK